MNARNDIEQYLRPGKFRFIAGVAGCVIAAALALLGVLINAGIVGATSKADAVPFGAMSGVQEGKYAYVDVVVLMNGQRALMTSTCICVWIRMRNCQSFV